MYRIKIAIVDDHKMVSKAIEDMIAANPKYEVVYNCSNGDEFIESLKDQNIDPDVVLMDINMPFRNGVETTLYLQRKKPKIKVIALTMEDNENTIIKMMRAGAKGYLLKDMPPELLFEAIETVYSKGSFYTDFLTQRLMKVKNDENNAKHIFEDLKDKEKEFLKLACTEITYKEIADKMSMSPKTIDGYRDSVFLKLDVKSRVGLVLFAIKHNMI
ncbi:MAG: response regulator transcription factor [Weeksellaceae bacterium]|nr:response regulator transcription factor [Weeksellaceae bacterium]